MGKQNSGLAGGLMDRHRGRPLRLVSRCALVPSSCGCCPVSLCFLTHPVVHARPCGKMALCVHTCLTCAHWWHSKVLWLVPCCVVPVCVCPTPQGLAVGQLLVVLQTSTPAVRLHQAQPKQS